MGREVLGYFRMSYLPNKPFHPQNLQFVSREWKDANISSLGCMIRSMVCIE